VSGEGWILRFRLARGDYALPLASVSGLAEPGPVRAVPGAPAGVLGLVEWHGRLLTLLDTPRLLNDAPQDEPGCVIRLAPPLDHTGLHVPASIWMEEASAEVTLLNPAQLVTRLEAEILATTTAPGESPSSGAASGGR
jgi:hypothetical protein